jgi:hypothetical protein
VPERELLADHPAHRDAEDMSALEAHRLHQRGGVVGEHGDAVGVVGLAAAADPALVKGEHLESLGDRREQVVQHAAVALRSVDEDHRVARAA